MLRLVIGLAVMVGVVCYPLAIILWAESVPTNTPKARWLWAGRIATTLIAGVLLLWLAYLLGDQFLALYAREG